MDPAAPAILSAAETLFQTMRDRDYRGIFASLTVKSRDTIVGETKKAVAAVVGNALSEEEVRRDFWEGGPLARNYWDAFLRRFDPDDALERSRWEMGPVKKDQAEVLITRHGVENPAVLKMHREEGNWKAGLVETFWTR